MNLSDQVIQTLVKYTKLVQGALYIYDEETKILITCCNLCLQPPEIHHIRNIKLGYGLIGQCAYEMDYIYRTEIPTIM